MSRAFVKEDSDAPEPVMERPVSDAPNRVTPRGLALIDAEIERLEALLPPPPADGSAEDMETGFNRRDARYWSQRRASAQVEEPDPDPRTIGFATAARIRRSDGQEQRIAIVGEDEADPAQGRIAWTSPLARALDGAEAGDRIEFEAGGNSETIGVVAVEVLGSE